MIQIEHPAVRGKAVDPTKLIRALQTRISSRYCQHGPSHALQALCCASIMAEPYILAGSLNEDVLGALEETARNLNLYSYFGEDVVETALAVGEYVYAELLQVERDSIKAVAT